MICALNTRSALAFVSAKSWGTVWTWAEFALRQASGGGGGRRLRQSCRACEGPLELGGVPLGGIRHAG